MGRIETVSILSTMSGMMMLLTMCGLKDLGGPERPDGPQPDIPPEETQDTLYITGVEYPAGYDWVKDVEYGTVACSLFVEKEGKRVLEVPVGYFYQTASDPDMHRLVGGHLYTDFSSDTETVIKKDGRTLFRYPGREMILSFFVSDSGDVYTVGESRSGDRGFVMRRNGEAVLETGSGYPVSEIMDADGTVCLVYRSLSSGDMSGRGGYYIFRDGVQEPLEAAGEGCEVTDAAYARDGLCYVAECPGKSMQDGYVALITGTGTYPLESGMYGTPSGCKILCDGKDICISGYCRRHDGGGYIYAAWDSSGRMLYSLSPGVYPYYSFVDHGDVYDLVSAASSFDMTVCYKNGALLYTYGRGAAFYSSIPSVMLRGSLYTVFSDRESSGCPSLAVGGEIAGRPFNGYFTGVSAW